MSLDKVCSYYLLTEQTGTTSQVRRGVSHKVRTPVRC